MTAPLGDLLRRFRERRGLTQEELATRVVPPLSVHTVGNVERGRTRPYRHTLQALSAALELGAHETDQLLRAWRETALVADGTTASDPAQDGAAPHTHSLPMYLTSFIGREQELADIAVLLQRTRLVTLTGPGGIGKTRLAIAAAAQRADRFRDGVWFVDLAGVTDPRGVVPAIAQVLAVGESPGRDLAASLATALQQKQLLLVLDNFEQVAAAASTLYDLVVQVPGLRLLVTSRVLLRVEGEQRYPVPPLPVPDPAAMDHAALVGSPAVHLFVERARALRPEFALNQENSAIVGAICARLDGLPLAIELAAARLRLVAAPALLSRLEQRLPFLTGGERTRPKRQQTLRAALQWSWELLEPAGQVLFRRLGVFAGGWTLEAAEAVCGPASDLGVDLLEGLASLVDQSLVRQTDVDSEPRFIMLATLREFALEQLARSGEAAAVQARHAGSFLALAETAAHDAYGPDWERWRPRLTHEYDNLRTALGWYSDHGEADAGLRLAGALLPLWIDTGQYSEGRRWAGAMLALPGAAAQTAGRATGLRCAGLLAQQQSDFGTARSLLAESVALWRELGAPRELAIALIQLGLTAASQEDHVAAQALFGESADLGRTLGDRSLLAYALHGLSLAASVRGDHAAVAPLAEASLTLFRQIKHRRGTAVPLNMLGELARRAGDYARAATLYEECLALQRAAQLSLPASAPLLNLAQALLQLGDNQRAAELLRESLTLVSQAGEKRPLAYAIAGCAGLAATSGEHEHAAWLLGAAEFLFAAIGAHWEEPDRSDTERCVGVAREELGAEAFAAAWSAGRALSLEQATALALAVTRSRAPVAS
jgi:predicted ATPase/DNA-binding XRE family transcriptional regulator